MTANPLDARASLLAAAQLLFARHAYEQVTTRDLAERAQVNSALIRYYFVDKAGLFETMLRETLAPLLQLLKSSEHTSETLPQFIAAYYQVMTPRATLPKILFFALHDEQSMAHQLVMRVFGDVFDLVLTKVQQHLQQPGVLQPGVNPQLTMVSCMCLTVFPWLMPQVIRQRCQLSNDPQFWAELAQHQQRLLQQGLLQSQGHSTC